MKNLKNKKRSLIQILVLVAAVVLVAEILIVVLIDGQEGEDTTLPTGTGETQATDATTATGGKENQSTNLDSGDEKEDQTTLITPYCTLKYPKELAGYLRVEVSDGNPYTATYYADLESGKTQELFSISFGGSSESALGTVTTSAGETVPVHVSSADFQPDSSWSDREINIVFIMQEAMNDVLDSMAMTTVDQSSQGGPNLPEDDGEEMVIDTPYGELRYPSRWKDYLEVVVNEKSGYAVEFWCKMDGHDAVKLFTVHYGGSKGIAASTAKDSNGKTVEVRMEVQELELNDTWSNEEKSIAAAMQEDLNYLLSNLS